MNPKLAVHDGIRVGTDLCGAHGVAEAGRCGPYTQALGGARVALALICLLWRQGLHQRARTDFLQIATDHAVTRRDTLLDGNERAVGGAKRPQGADQPCCPC